MIDAHVHAFPDEAQGRAWQTLAGFEATRPGTLPDLAPRLVAAGVERAVLLLYTRSSQRADARRASSSTAPDEVAIRAAVAREIAALNDWGCAVAAADPRFVAFVGVNPRFQAADELEATIRRGHAAGARGVKMIPPAMALYPDDEPLVPVHATCAALGLPILSQSGSGGGTAPGPRGHYGRPGAWHGVLAAFPGLRVVLAHLGRGYEEELVALAARHEGVRSDTSLRLGSPDDEAGWSPDGMRDLVRRIGVERVLFGSNYPMGDPVASRDRLDRLGLTPRELDLVGRVNAERLLEAS